MAESPARERNQFLRMVVVALVACVAMRPAYADQTAPWAVGVTPEAEKTAQAELQLGNARFLDKDYAGALERYRAAIDRGSPAR